MREKYLTWVVEGWGEITRWMVILPVTMWVMIMPHRKVSRKLLPYHTLMPTTATSPNAATVQPVRKIMRCLFLLEGEMDGESLQNSESCRPAPMGDDNEPEEAVEMISSYPEDVKFLQLLAFCTEHIVVSYIFTLPKALP